MKYSDALLMDWVRHHEWCAAIDGGECTCGLDDARIASDAAATKDLSDGQIRSIAEMWAKEPGFADFEWSDLIACIRECIKFSEACRK